MGCARDSIVHLCMLHFHKKCFFCSSHVLSIKFTIANVLVNGLGSDNNKSESFLLEIRHGNVTSAKGAFQVASLN